MRAVCLHTTNSIFARGFVFGGPKLDDTLCFIYLQTHAVRRGRGPERLVLVRGPLPQEGGEIAAASVRHGVLKAPGGWVQRPGPHVQGGCGRLA